jgi:cytosine/creatinine deaminase
MGQPDRPIPDRPQPGDLPPAYGILGGQVHSSLLGGFVPQGIADPDTPSPHNPRGRETKPWEAGGRDGLVAVDLEIRSGKIAQIAPRGALQLSPLTPCWDWRGGQIWPCFVDVHTHLDKGHIWERSPNPDGTFVSALATVQRDSLGWTQGDLLARMEFGLTCSYRHGTQALRTHLDSGGALGPLVWEVFRELRSRWADRLLLQGVCLVPGDYFLTAAGEALADEVAASGGILGAVLFCEGDLPQQLDRIFALAGERGLALDFHTDESGRVGDRALYAVAKAQLRHQLPQPITCGHCCSLAVQPEPQLTEILATVVQAGLTIVSLPLCNLYLQDRQGDRTPRWRGIAPIQEIAAAGIPVALASDNCRDPFYGFGDHDLWEVFRESVRIGHLDRPYGSWPQAITTTPAQMMGLSHGGQICAGAGADLVLFRGRGFSEVLSRPQVDRVVLRGGQAIETTPPDYRDLDAVLLSPNPGQV